MAWGKLDQTFQKWYNQRVTPLPPPYREKRYPYSDNPFERSICMKLSEDVRKVMMAGIGALTTVTEKTQETIDSLAKKGEEALNHGQAINERLRHKIKEIIDDEEKPENKTGKDEGLRALDPLTPEEIEAVKAKLNGLGHDGE